MSRLVAVFNALPADLRAKFARFEHEESWLAVFHLSNEVPCVRENRFISWVLGGRFGCRFPALSAGFDPIPCDPNDPEQVESALLQGLRQLETGEEWSDEERQEEPIVWPVPAIPADLVSPVPALPDLLEELEQIFLRGLQLIQKIRER